MSKKINIYIAAHKKCRLPETTGYIPLHVGAENKKDLNYVKDNTGDNISLKNSNYCELTGIYWIWKNVKCDITGLVHYRRYFFKKSHKHKLENIISTSEIAELLNNYDIIVPKKVKIIYPSIEEQFIKFHNKKDYEITREVIKEKYPDYLESFNRVSKRKYIYPYNMLITNKKIFDSYCNWLFDILFEIEKRVDMSDYSDYDKRLFGFLSERLFNVWLDNNKKLKIKELYVYNIDKSYLKQRLIEIIKNIVIH